MYTYDNRKKMLEAIKYVDKVIPINKQEDKFKYIKDFDIDEFVIGEEYRAFKDIPDIQKLTKVIFLSRTPNISTTQIKQKLINKEYKTLVIDIDDTILTVSNRDFLNTKPFREVITKINELHEIGYKIILLTARGMKSQNNDSEKAKQKYDKITKEWLERHNVYYDELLFGKPNADYYVDDKAMPPKEFVKTKF